MGKILIGCFDDGLEYFFENFCASRGVQKTAKKINKGDTKGGGLEYLLIFLNFK